MMKLQIGTGDNPGEDVHALIVRNGDSYEITRLQFYRSENGKSVDVAQLHMLFWLANYLNQANEVRRLNKAKEV